MTGAILHQPAEGLSICRVVRVGFKRASNGEEHVFVILHVAHGLSNLFEHNAIMLVVLIGAARVEARASGEKKC